MFSRIAIVNRGEAAMRLIHAVRELNAETGRTRSRRSPSTPTPSAPPRSSARRTIAYCLGPGLGAPVPRPRRARAGAASRRGADAAWVGWGFVAEDPAFAELCEKIGVTFIGPSADAMRRLGDKIGAKLIAEEVGVPVAPWSRGAVGDPGRRRSAAADEIGYPLMLKATAGGGGRGIRMVAVGRRARRRLRAHQPGGAARVRQRRRVPGAPGHRRPARRGAGHRRRPGHRLGAGRTRLLGPAPQPEGHRGVRLPGARARAGRRAEGVGRAARPGGRTTAAPAPSSSSTTRASELFAFLEVNTRLQVEHPITEVTTGIDLVKAQLHVAARRQAGRATARRPRSGHAVEARLNAEDPDRDFAPAPGRIARLALPAGPGIRVDTGVSEGDTIPADFDSMIAKIIAYGRDRDRGARPAAPRDGRDHRDHRGRRDQQELRARPARPARGDRRAAPTPAGSTGSATEGRLVATGTPAIALAAAAIEAYEDEEEVERQRLLATAHGGRPQVQHESGRPLDLKLRGAGYRVTRRPDRAATGSGSASRRRPRAPRRRRDRAVRRAQRPDPGQRPALPAGHRPRTGRSTWSRSTASRTGSAATRAACVRSPAPALVVATPVAVGDEVEAGAPVLVLESMKMETVLRAPFRARVRECLVSVGSQVETGAPLLRLEPLRRRGRARRRGHRGRSSSTCRAEPADVSAAEPGRARPAGPAQPAARLRRRPARRARGLCRLPGRAGRAGRPADRRRGRAAAPCSPTCPS